MLFFGGVIVSINIWSSSSIILSSCTVFFCLLRCHWEDRKREEMADFWQQVVAQRTQELYEETDSEAGWSKSLANLATSKSGQTSLCLDWYGFKLGFI